MRVLLMTAGNVWGGLEVHAAALATTLEGRGHDVAIVQLGSDAFAQKTAGRELQTRVVHVPLRTSDGRQKHFRDVSLAAWCRILKRLHGDVCIFTKGDFDVGSWQLDAAARLCFDRYVTIEQLAHPMPPKESSLHFGGILPGLGLWWYGTVMRRRLRSPWPHIVVCVSEAVRAPLVEHYGFSPRKLVTIYNGTDISVFRPDAAVRRRIRHSWGVSPDALVFGSVGRLHPRKGFEIAVDSFRQLTRAFPGRDMRLVLAGEGPARADLENRVRESGLAARVLFTGYTDRPQDLYPALDVFLLPSQNEGLPLALIEAMACACSPIATRVGGIPEVLVDPGLGWLVEPGLNTSFVQAMKSAAHLAPGRLIEMGQRAREHVARHFDARVLLAAMADLVEDTATRLRPSFGFIRGGDPRRAGTRTGAAENNQPLA